MAQVKTSGGVVVDTKTFKRGVDALMREYKTDAEGVLKRQMSMTAGVLARKYPPHGQKGMAKKNSMRMGKRAIEGDLKKIMVPVPTEDYDDLREWEEDYKGTRDVFDYQGTRLKAWHRANFNQSRNRVTNAIKGNWQGYGRKFSNKLHVKQSSMNKLVKELSKDVGKLAGGWTAGAVKWPGASSANKPGWLTKFKGNGKAYSRFRNGSGYVVIENRVSGAARWGRIDKFVMRTSQNRFTKQIKEAIKKANKAGNKPR